MRTLGKFILAILAAAIGGLLVVAFQEPLLERISKTSLSIEVSGGPWSPMAPDTGDLARAWERQGVPSYHVRQILDGQPPSMARIEIQNVSAETVSQIRITTGEFPPERFLVLQNEEAPARYGAVREFTIAPLEPGERAIIYVWSIHNLQSRYFFDDWNVFSSQGQERVRLRVMQSVRASEAFFDIVSDSVGQIAVFLLLLGVILMTIGLAVYSAYLKQIFGDEEHYSRERARFLADPKKFSIDLKQ